MKRFLLLLLTIFVAFAAFAEPVSEVTQEASKRIVSAYYISSSACLAMGLRDNLVAVEAQADKRPLYQMVAPELIDKPNVGTAKSFNLETCLAAEPDLVILPKKQKDMAKTLEELGIKTLVVSPESHEEIIEMFTLIGEATGHEEEASQLIERYTGILSLVEEKTKDLQNRPTVYMCGMDNYLKTAAGGMYQSSLIEQAGGINASASIEGSSWVVISYEQFLAFNPDVIIIPTNSNANGTPDYSIEDILSDPQLAEVTAVKTKSIYQMPVGFEAWDSPVPSGALGTLWMMKTLHPELYTDEEFKAAVESFYKDVYKVDAQF